MRRVLLTFLAVGLMLAAPAAYGDIWGFGDGTGFTFNANGNAATAGMPAMVAPGELQITSTANNQATSVFNDTRQYIDFFSAKFDYQLTGGSDPPANGACFVIQGVGPTALGGAGGNRGYAGIGNSIAVGLNLWEDRSDVDEGLNGSFWARHPTDPVNLRGGNLIRTKLDYDGATMTMSVGLEDLITGSTYYTSWYVDIVGAVGGSTGYVGFSGGTGGANAEQLINNFSYNGGRIPSLTWDELGTDNWDSLSWTGGPPDVPNGTTHAVLAGTNTDTVIVANPATAATVTVNGGGIHVLDDQTFTVRGSMNTAAGTTLTLDKNATLAVGVGGSISDLIATAGNATIDIGADLTVTNFLGNVLPSTAGTFTKTGQGTLLLTDTATAPLSTFEVKQGTLATRCPEPFGGAKTVILDGGGVSLQAPPGTADVSDVDVIVRANSVLTTNTDGVTALGNLLMDSGVSLAVTTGMASFADVTAGDGTVVDGDLGIRGAATVGNSVGTLTVAGDLLLTATTTYAWELTSTGSDLIDVTGNLTVADGWTLAIDTAETMGLAGTQYPLITYGGSSSMGLAAAFDVSSAAGWDAAALIITDAAGTISLEVVPEPSTIAMLLGLAGIGGLAVLLRRCS